MQIAAAATALLLTIQRRKISDTETTSEIIKIQTLKKLQRVSNILTENETPTYRCIMWQNVTK
jgi:hypothetical protein